MINNKEKSIFLRRLFYLVSIAIALGALALFLLDYTLYGILMVAVFAFWFLFFQVADYQSVEFNVTDSKILLRYYKIVSFGKRSFNSIEFPSKMLHNAHFENSVFGKLSDLTLFVKTRRGVAEYPSVSLTAMPLAGRKKMQEQLLRIMGI